MNSLSALLLCFVGVQAADIMLHHRVIHSTLQDAPWLEHASVSLTDNLSQLQVLRPPALAELLNSAKDVESAFFQVALKSEHSEWSTSSVKLCHLAHSTSQTLFLQLSSDGTPYALDYFVSPVPLDGSCPADSPATLPHLNTTVVLQKPSYPPLPELSTPPPLTPEGTVYKPPPEKSFLQKYWLYIGALLVATLMATGEEPPAERGGSSGPR